MLVDEHWDLSCTPCASKMLPKTGTMSDLLTIFVLAENPHYISVTSTLKRLLPVEAVSRKHNVFSYLT